MPSIFRLFLPYGKINPVTCFLSMDAWKEGWFDVITISAAMESTTMANSYYLFILHTMTVLSATLSNREAAYLHRVP